MAELDKQITIKLNIDGKEALITLDLSELKLKKNVQAAIEVDAALKKTSSEGIPAFKKGVNETAQVTERPFLKNFARDLLLVEGSAEETTLAILEFINVNQLSEREIETVTRLLREQQASLTIGSKEWAAHNTALANLNNAVQMSISGQRQFAMSSSSARMAVSQLGFALGDASMIAIDFRMFLMAIGNNIPFVIQGLSKVAQEAKAAEMSFGAFLKNNMDASMKMVLGANALMFALMVLPSIFKAIDSASDEAADGGMKKFNEELKEMTSAQISSRLEQIRTKIADIKKESDKLREETIIIDPITGQLIISPFNLPSGEEPEKEKALSEEEKKLEEQRTRIKGLLELEIADYDKLIDQVKIKTGLDEESYKLYFGSTEKKLSAEEQLQRLIDMQAEKQKELDNLLMSTEERERKKKEEIEKQVQAQEKLRREEEERFDQALREIELRVKLAELKGEDTSAATRTAIEEINKLLDQQNLSLEREVELRTLLKDLTGEPAKKSAEGPEEGPSAEPLKERRDTLIRIQELEDDFRINAIQDQFERERAMAREEADNELDFFRDKLNRKIITKEEFERIELAIEEEYNRRSRELDQEAFLFKISMYSQIVSAWQNALNTMYSVAEANASREINLWKSKEERKLDQERDAALKHARTQAERERINERFDKKQEQLEEEAQRRAEEKLIVWFRLKQLGDIAAATMSTYKAATSALEPPPTGLGPVFGWPLMAAVIAGGMANVAMIMSQKIPGYRKGGAIVGEDGPEIIAPFQDYASGQAKLITMTMMTLRDEIRSGNANQFINNGSNSPEISELRDVIGKLNRKLDEGIKAQAVFNKKIARQIYVSGSSQGRRGKLG